MKSEFFVVPLLLIAGCAAPPAPPLVRAARTGDTGAIASLIANGANPNQPWGVNEWTPLMHAIHKNQAGAVEALIAAGGDVNAHTGSGVTALMLAAAYGYDGIVKTLLEHGADTHSETEDGENALASAVGGVVDIDRFTLGRCQTATVEALLAKDPALRLPDNLYGRTAHFVAAAAGCSDVLAMVDRKRPPAQPAQRGRV